MKVPFTDFEKKISKHRKIIDAAIQRVLNSSQFILGSEVSEFEKNFSKFISVKNSVGVANGTDALEIALKVIGIKPGDSVGTTAHCGNYASTAITTLGANPVYLEISRSDLNLNLANLKKIEKTSIKALVLTHMYGNPVNETFEIVNYCKENEIILIEDCAQSCGARINGIMTGSIGDISTFSFYPTKNLGGLGDAGMISTNNFEYFEKALMLRTYGWKEKYNVEVEGGRNSRLDEIQAAILNDLLPFLENENEIRRQISQSYLERIANSLIETPTFQKNKSVFHIFPIISEYRDELLTHLQRNKVGYAIHYPIADHLQSIRKNKAPNLPITELLTKQILSIPCYPEMSTQQVNFVIDILNKFKL